MKGTEMAGMDPVVFTFVVLGVYLIGLKVLGFVALSRSKKTSGDYFLSGRSIGLIALTGTTMASLLSTGTVVGNPPNFYTKGLNHSWVMFFGLLTTLVLVLGLRFWKLSKSHGYITPGQMMGDLYGSRRVQLVFALVGLLCLVPYAMAQLVAIGKLFVGLAGEAVGYELGVCIAAVVMAVFLLAGARAVIWTDVVQGLMFTILLAVAAYLVVGWSGGWQPMMDNFMAAKPADTHFEEVNHWRVFEFTLAIPALFALPYMWQRMFMANSSRDLSRMVLVTPPLYVIIILSSWILGVSAWSIFPAQETSELAAALAIDKDRLLGLIFQKNAPYFGAFILVAAFSAGVSSVDSQLLTAASLVTKDLMRTKGEVDEAREFRIGRLTTLVMLVLVTVLALFLQKADLMQMILLGIFLSSAFVPAALATFFWRRCSEPAIFYSVLAGLVGYCVRALVPGAAGWVEGAGLISWCMGASLLVLVVVSLLRPCVEPDPRRFGPV